MFELQGESPSMKNIFKDLIMVLNPIEIILSSFDILQMLNKTINILMLDKFIFCFQQLTVTTRDSASLVTAI